MAPAKRDWQSSFTTFCIGLMTPAVIGAFGFLWNLNTTVVTMAANDARQDVELKEIKVKIESVRNDISATTLEIVRVKAECDNRWDDVKRFMRRP